MMHRIDITGMSDEDLMHRSAQGDEQAFLALYRRRQAGIFRFALHMCGSEAIAEEVTQEVFLAVISDGARFDEARGSAAAYLYGVARNQVRRCLEKNRRYIGLEDEETSIPELEASDPGPLAQLTRLEAIEALREAILTLPAGYREAIVLCDLEEVSYADAAEALKVPVGTVRSRLNRGRALLAEKLGPSVRPAKGFNALRSLA